MDNEDLPKSQTRVEYQLGLLKARLSQPNWNFSRGRNSFAGNSEGVCILSGIDPTAGYTGSEGIGWEFLPGGLEYHGFTERPSWADAYQLDEVIQMTLDRILALELRGRQKVGEAIKVVLAAEIDIPWMETARRNEELSRMLDSVLGDTPAEPSERKPSPKLSEASKKKADLRWQEDDNKKLRNTLGRQLFEELLANGFEACKSGAGNVKKSKIREEIIKGLKNFTGSEEGLPAARTIDCDVNQMLVEFGVDLRDYRD